MDSEMRQGTIRCFLPTAHFTAGRYYLNIVVAGRNRKEWYGSYRQAAAFDIVEADVFGTGRVPDGGPCFFHAEWSSDHHKVGNV